MPEFRHRTDVKEFEDMYSTLCSQIDLISGTNGWEGYLKQAEKRELAGNVKETVKNIINVLIAISEQLHDYKDKEIEKSLQEISHRDNELIDLSKE